MDGMMIWAYFAAMGPEHLAVIDSAMNSSAYQSTPELNVTVCRTAKARLTLRHATRQSSQTQQQIYKGKEMLTRAAYQQMPTRFNEVKQSCKKKEWAKIPPQLCGRLIKPYEK